jgi:hypothetical protein
MSWQKCPICLGSGLSLSGLKCTVCNGQKIISEVTGLPPSPNREYAVDPNKTDTTNGNIISSRRT